MPPEDKIKKEPEKQQEPAPQSMNAELEAENLRLINEITGIIRNNPVKIAEAPKSASSSDFGKVLDAYFPEYQRVRTLTEQHFRSITNDNTFSLDHPEPLLGKLNKLQDAFSALLTEPAHQSRLNGCFQDIREAITKIGRVNAPLNEKSVIFSPEQYMNPWSEVDNSLMALQGIYEKNISPELRESKGPVFKAILGQLDNLMLVNKPEKPEKDMVGLRNDGPMEQFSTLMSVIRGLPMSLRRCSDNDPSLLFRDSPELKDIADQSAVLEQTFRNKLQGNALAGDPNAQLTKFAQSINNALGSLPLFDSELPGFQPMPGQEHVSQVFEGLSMMQDSLRKLSNHLPDNPGLKAVADNCMDVLDRRMKEEYRRNAEIAFSGDVLNEPEAKKAWYKLSRLSQKMPELDKQFQQDRLAMMLLKPDFCQAEMAEARKTLDGIQEKGSYYAIPREKRRYAPEDIHHKYIHSAENLIQQARDDAQQTLIVGEIAMKGHRFMANPVPTEKEYLENAPSVFVMSAMKEPSKSGNIQNLRKYAAKLAAEAQKLPNTQNDVYLNTTEKERHGLSPEVFRDLTYQQRMQYGFKNDISLDRYTQLHRQSVERVRDAFCFGANGVPQTELQKASKKAISGIHASENSPLGLSAKELSPLMGKGSPEALALKEKIVDCVMSIRNGAKCKAEDLRPLYEKSVEYISLKSSVPITSSGKERARAAAQVLRKVGPKLMECSEPQAADKIKDDIKTYMMRNKEFRDQILADNIKLLSDSQKQNSAEAALSPAVRKNSMELIAFACECDRQLKNKGINNKLDSASEKKKMAILMANITSSVFPKGRENGVDQGIVTAAIARAAAAEKKPEAPKAAPAKYVP